MSSGGNSTRLFSVDLCEPSIMILPYQLPYDQAPAIREVDLLVKGYVKLGNGTKEAVYMLLEDVSQEKEVLRPLGKDLPLGIDVIYLYEEGMNAFKRDLPVAFPRKMKNKKINKSENDKIFCEILDECAAREPCVGDAKSREEKHYKYLKRIAELREPCPELVAFMHYMLLNVNAAFTEKIVRELKELFPNQSQTESRITACVHRILRLYEGESSASTNDSKPCPSPEAEDSASTTTSAPAKNGSCLIILPQFRQLPERISAASGGKSRCGSKDLNDTVQIVEHISNIFKIKKILIAQSNRVKEKVKKLINCLNNNEQLKQQKVEVEVINVENNELKADICPDEAKVYVLPIFDYGKIILNNLINDCKKKCNSKLLILPSTFIGVKKDFEKSECKIPSLGNVFTVFNLFKNDEKKTDSHQPDKLIKSYHVCTVDLRDMPEL